MHLIDYNPEVFEPVGQMLDLTRKVRISEDGVHTSGQVRRFVANLATALREFAENANSLIRVDDSTVNP